MNEAADRRAEVEPTDIAKMIEILREAGWREAYLRMGDFELRLSTDSTPAGGDGAASEPPHAPNAAGAASSLSPEPPPAHDGPTSPTPPQDPTQSAPDPALHVLVRAQSLGVFWRAPQPGAPPFVEVGDQVAEDTPLAIVEVMKMMTRITPNCRGKVAAIHVANGETVEFDQPLMSIDPA